MIDDIGGSSGVRFRIAYSARAFRACVCTSQRGADRGAVPTDIDWNISPLDLDLRDMNGERYTFHWPPGKPKPSHVVGSGPYSDASSICQAGVHAGVLHAQRGAGVHIEIRPGEQRHIGSQRHYLHSVDEAAGWSGSFIVIESGSDAGHP